MQVVHLIDNEGREINVQVMIATNNETRHAHTVATAVQQMRHVIAAAHELLHRTGIDAPLLIERIADLRPYLAYLAAPRAELEHLLSDDELLALHQ
jgi:hypothetical protein